MKEKGSIQQPSRVYITKIGNSNCNAALRPSCKMRIVLEYPWMLQDLVEAEPILRFLLEKLYSTVRKEGTEVRYDPTSRMSE